MRKPLSRKAQQLLQTGPVNPPQEAPVVEPDTKEHKDPVAELASLLKKRKDQGISAQEASQFEEWVFTALESRGVDIALKNGRICLETNVHSRVSEASMEGVFDPSRGTHRFLILSDSHIGGRQAQPWFLKEMFQEAEKRKCQAVLHCGDHIDGSPKMHKGFEYELSLLSCDQQVDFTVEIYRQSQVPIFAVTGNHDGSFFKDSGINVGRLLEERLDNFKHLGPISGWIAGPNDDPNFIRLSHPGDGCSYALSYKDQKMAEYLVLEDSKVPTGFHMTGHYHKMNYMRGPLGAKYLLVPSSCARTDFMKAKKLVNWAGAFFIEFTIDKHGKLDRCVVEDIPLYPDKWIPCDYSEFLRPRHKNRDAGNIWMP